MHGKVREKFDADGGNRVQSIEPFALESLHIVGKVV
jgi:hypothetical protein